SAAAYYDGFQGYLPVTVELDASRRVVTITPRVVLSPFTGQSVSLSVWDIAGNPGSYSTGFTTGEAATDPVPPTVTRPSPPGFPPVGPASAPVPRRVRRRRPPAGSREVPANALVRVELSEPVNQVTVDSSTFRFLKGQTPVAGSLDVDRTSRYVTFTPAAALE